MELLNDILAFSAGEACLFSGVAFKRLDGWARSGFIVPSLQAPHADYHARRRYSFRDLVELTVARKFRDIGVSLQALRTIQKLLRRDYQAPFAEAWLITDGIDVFELREKQTDIISVLRHPGQSCLPFTVLDVGRTVEELIAAATAQRAMTVQEIREHIARDEIAQRKPTQMFHGASRDDRRSRFTYL
jgi:DNA-binding transcriptional MerR regulator